MQELHRKQKNEQTGRKEMAQKHKDMGEKEIAIITYNRLEQSGYNP